MDTEYNNFLADKDVVIVGGDDASICDDALATADVVVRINDHWRRQRRGCDVLYYSCDNRLDLEMFDDPAFAKQIQWVWLNKMHTLFDAGAGNYFHVRRRLVGSVRDSNIKFFYQAPEPAFAVFEKLRQLPPEYDWLKVLAATIGDSPLTGMIAVEHLRLSAAARVHVTGMNFYMNDPVKLAETKTHNMALQLQWFKRVVESDKRFSVSPALELILNEHSR